MQSRPKIAHLQAHGEGVVASPRSSTCGGGGVRRGGNPKQAPSVSRYNPHHGRTRSGIVSSLNRSLLLITLLPFCIQCFILSPHRYISSRRCYGEAPFRFRARGVQQARRDLPCKWNCSHGKCKRAIRAEWYVIPAILLDT